MDILRWESMRADLLLEQGSSGRGTAVFGPCWLYFTGLNWPECKAYHTHTLSWYKGDAFLVWLCNYKDLFSAGMQLSCIIIFPPNTDRTFSIMGPLYSVLILASCTGRQKWHHFHWHKLHFGVLLASCAPFKFYNITQGPRLFAAQLKISVRLYWFPLPFLWYVSA